MHTFGNILYYQCSHKDDYTKRHLNRQESPRILWKYGVIASDNIPFLIVKSSEFQCQYGHPRKYNSAKKQVQHT